MECVKKNVKTKTNYRGLQKSVHKIILVTDFFKLMRCKNVIFFQLAVN